ncbi:hypothetical protein V1477_006764 [Vespula maculifrons]|uniref:Uncharacterized protein n=1 Tax=Vespula maculifrons TaxID=7453 RepID=A0ABD2CGL6_VESMC
MDGYEYDEEVHSVLETFAKRNNDSGDRKLSGLVADALATPGSSCSPIGDYKPAHGYWGAPRVVVRGGAMPIGGLQPAIRGGLLFRRILRRVKCNTEHASADSPSQPGQRPLGS